MAIKFLSIIALLSLASAPAFAQSQGTDVRPNANRVTGEDLLEAFSGLTHNGAYNFSRQGEAANFYTEFHSPDGSVTYREGALEFSGRWWLKRNSKICYTYEETVMTGGCFRVYQVGTCFYFYSDTFIETKNELDRDYWIARSVQNGNEPTCEATFS